ncbi:MAG TPA: thioredoxin domain-containing protein [Pyrinomonadaceae bacterium]|nr:thioredoxin domain-containing protein [Chloracidobacterium sp.]MBP9934898.1 thioredoxin domain-containing protein [Pyrinomonadaceae bacterium]MBK7803326.1 thioredoxin domain-containing protein [Chloracidobacterium sp.]MBK9438576.1 thioredoxin domain-containing protein [Chloracidobacterium sp.]MBL0241099.1 thioredoxin domain-containing protein [Chloracidobacterium sp.]
MKPIYIAFLLLFAAAISAQQPIDPLATSTVRTFKLAELSPEAQAGIVGLTANTAKARTQLLEQLTAEALLSVEAAGKQITKEKLLGDIRAKSPEPTEAEINTVYKANVDALGNKPLADVRKMIVKYLKGEAEQKQIQALIAGLRAKYKVTAVRDVNARDLKPADILVNVAGTVITAGQFDAATHAELFDLKADAIDRALFELDDLILRTLAGEEAKAKGIDTADYFAAEITNKLKDFSDEEREKLVDDLSGRLFAKYNVKIQLVAPEPPVENISVDDDPAQGPANAPVTIVMFSDFQCPACSATHPILKKAIAEFPGKIRFVVRDFPLTSIHENAFNAALAAGAATAQGKFFEYSDLLYQRQDALDPVSLKRYAAELGLNVKQFEIDFSSEKIAAEVLKDKSDGENYGIGGTPTVFVNGVRVRQLSATGFRKAITKALVK